MRRLGRPHLHLLRTGSTNERARELAWSGAPDGTLVTAAEQTAGRGRQGRTWSAPAGHALLMSVVLRDVPPVLPLAAAVALSDIVGPEAQIKWPNDVLVRERKLAGILVEGRPHEGWAVLGIGVNVAVRIEDLPPELADSAATLGLRPADVGTVLQRLLRALEHRLEQPVDALLADYAERDVLRGRPVTFAGGTGTAAGIDSDGRLVVDLPGGGRTAVAAGEVHIGHLPDA